MTILCKTPFARTTTSQVEIIFSKNSTIFYNFPHHSFEEEALTGDDWIKCISEGGAEVLHNKPFELVMRKIMILLFILMVMMTRDDPPHQQRGLNPL